MRRVIPLVLVLAAPAAHAAERAFPVSAFDRLAARGSPTVEVRTGRAASVVATGDPADLDRLQIEVVNGELRTGFKPTNAGWRWTSKPVTITVTTPALRAAALAGSGDVNIDRVAGGAFDAKLAGSGDLRLRDVDALNVSIALAGSGDVSASGRCRDARVSLSGSGDVRAGGLRCEAVRAALVGSGGIDAYASRSADVSVTGSGDVRVGGGGACSQSKRGSGSIRCG